jgi:hypothetical protein
MLVQPWHLDSYPFVAEAVYVARNKHLADFHYLLENPALGLAFAPYLLITGISPISLLKIYPGLLVLILIVIVYMITNKLQVGSRASTVASLLFISIFWPNVFHFSRQSVSIIYYLISLFLLMRLVFQGLNRRLFALLLLQIFILTISHPATSLIFTLNLAAMTIFGRISRKISSKESRLINHTLIISVIIWFLWNMIGTKPGNVVSLVNMSERVVTSLMENPSKVSGTATIFAAHTPAYDLIIKIRFMLTFFVYLFSFLVPLVMYRHFKNRRVLLILTGWTWSNMAIAIPILYLGLPYFQKPVLFLVTSWGPLAILVFKINSITKIKTMYVLAVVFITFSSLLIPVIKYAPLPLESVTSKDLASKSFLDFYGNKTGEFIYSEDPPYYYSYILYNQNEHIKTYGLRRAYLPGGGLDPDIVRRASLWITNRVLVRDAFFLYSPSMYEVIKNATETFPKTTHNKVYDSGWPEWILILSRKSENFHP